MERLPVPDIRDDVICHTQKQSHRREDSNRYRPPKVKQRYYHDSNFNRSQSSGTVSTSALAISFRGENYEFSEPDSFPLTNSYNNSLNETYFEQNFTRLGKIGEGSFGEVFKVRSKDDGLLYAVKMSKQLFRSEHYRQERLQEVRRYEQFSDHANCIKFYRAWEQDDRLYMQMELCRESLDRYLWRRRQISEERIWSILLDLLCALKSLHDRNLIHLDIKLDNVLMDEDETCKLADFGLVIDIEKANRQQATEGDSRYIAPEIMQGHFSKAADIFSLGIAMLELSCYLELPSNGPLWQQLRNGILPEEFIRSISIELQTIIKDMMTPDPKARPTVDQLLSHKKLEALKITRNHWNLLKRVHKKVRATRRLFWSKLCNIKQLAFRFVISILDTLRLHKSIEAKPDQNRADFKPTPVTSRLPEVRTHLIESTPILPDVSGRSAFHLLQFDLSQHGTPSNFAPDKLVNSTPVNHNHHSFKSRKDLTKTSFRTILSEDDNSSVVEHSNNFLSLDEIETRSNSISRKRLDAISLRGKKLFGPFDEELQ